jgi:hypothetical protein
MIQCHRRRHYKVFLLFKPEYNHYLEVIQPTVTKFEYVSFFDVEVVSEEDGVWTTDNTDSICDLQCFLTYVDNYVNKRHKKADVTWSLTTNGSDRRDSNGVTDPSSLPSSSFLPQSLLPPHNPRVTAPSSTTGIFTDIPSIPGDLVDNFTRSGSLSFLSELFDTDRLFELHDFRIEFLEKWFSIAKICQYFRSRSPVTTSDIDG